jgi:hypothetical protein
MGRFQYKSIPEEIRNRGVTDRAECPTCHISLAYLNRIPRKIIDMTYTEANCSIFSDFKTCPNCKVRLRARFDLSHIVTEEYQTTFDKSCLTY